MTEISETEFIDLILGQVRYAPNDFKIKAMTYTYRHSKYIEHREIESYLQNPETNHIRISMTGDSMIRHGTVERISIEIERKRNRYGLVQPYAIYTDKMAKYYFRQIPISRNTKRFIRYGLSNNLEFRFSEEDEYDEGFDYDNYDRIVSNMRIELRYYSRTLQERSYLMIRNRYPTHFGDIERDRVKVCYIFPNSYTGRIEVHTGLNSSSITELEPPSQYFRRNS